MRDTDSAPTTSWIGLPSTSWIDLILRQVFLPLAPLDHESHRQLLRSSSLLFHDDDNYLCTFRAESLTDNCCALPRSFFTTTKTTYVHSALRVSQTIVALFLAPCSRLLFHDNCCALPRSCFLFLRSFFSTYVHSALNRTLSLVRALRVLCFVVVHLSVLCSCTPVLALSDVVHFCTPLFDVEMSMRT